MRKLIIQDIKPRRGNNQISKIKINNESLIAVVDHTVDEKSINNEEGELITKDYFNKNTFNRQRLQNTPQFKKKPKPVNNIILIIFVMALVFGGVFWGGKFFHKVNITITSKYKNIEYKNKLFSASKNNDTSGVDFEVMITTDNKIKNIILTEPKEVSENAKGSIILYNEFNTTPQKLLIGTFVSDEKGYTYKIDNTITIPGYKKDSNNKIIPGQINANITAFLPGDSYNGSPSIFNISSFKGTTKYKKIYGKLDKPLAGGASGLVYIMNNEDIARMNNTAETSFKDDLIKKAKALVPPEYILYPNAMNFSYQIKSEITSKTPEADIEISGSLSVLLLREKSLMDNIINISLPEVKGEELKEIKVLALDKLIFNFVNKDQLITKEANTIPFFLTGNIDAIWYPDIELLKTKLVGINKNEALTIFRQDPGIAGAIVKVFPPWKKYFPNELSKIDIILK
jgi:hypothetical protein